MPLSRLTEGPGRTPPTRAVGITQAQQKDGPAIICTADEDVVQVVVGHGNAVGVEVEAAPIAGFVVQRGVR